MNLSYNRRQYQRMLESIAAYESDRIGLGALISNLEGLLNSLESLPREWRQDFIDRWSILEEVHAFALYQDSTQVEKQYKQLLDRAIAGLKQSINSQMNSAVAS